MLICLILSALLHPLRCSEADSSCGRAPVFVTPAPLDSVLAYFLPFLFCLLLLPTFSLKLVLGIYFSLSTLVNGDGDKGAGFLMRKEGNK